MHFNFNWLILTEITTHYNDYVVLKKSHESRSTYSKHTSYRHMTAGVQGVSCDRIIIIRCVAAPVHKWYAFQLRPIYNLNTLIYSSDRWSFARWQRLSRVVQIESISRFAATKKTIWNWWKNNCIGLSIGNDNLQRQKYSRHLSACRREQEKVVGIRHKPQLIIFNF